MNKIWDTVRQKWVENTPEEQVRQYIIHLLHTDYGYPLGRMSVEKTLPNAPKQLRFDLVIYDTQAKPLFLVECKAPSVALSEQTLEQISRYNIYLNAPYLLITNGNHTLCFSQDKGHTRVLETIPTFSY